MYRGAADEGPQEIAERLPAGGQHQIGLGILDGGGDLGTVANDAGVGQQGSNFLLVVAGDPVRIEAIEYLKGNYLPDTYELTTALCTQMLLSSSLADSPEEAKSMIDTSVSSGKALEKFREIIIAQGGDAKVLDDYSRFAQAPVKLPIIAATEGYVHSIDSRAIGYALVRIKAGRMKVTDTLDYAAGALLYPKIGDFIKTGQKLGEVHAATIAQAEDTAALILAAYKINPLPCKPESLILDIV